MSVLLATTLMTAVMGDMYLHNARGSNNRLDEARRDRNNANRLFDSQNNNRGGSNVGSLYYYVGEKLALEWTNQHGCGNSQSECEIVVQYMCDDRLRDGVTTRTIPETPSQCQNYDCNNDVRFGMHESYDYYMNCKYRFRNKGLFTADRNLNGQTARFTRQNNNGNRRGYECPEERDHYPYWHPTPWIDLAVYTNEPLQRCEFYQSESENVKGRYHCRLPDSWYHSMVRNGGNGNNGFIPNTEELCENLNMAGSRMNTFLATQAETSFAEAQERVSKEFQMCTAGLVALTEACPVSATTNQTDTTSSNLACRIARQNFLADGVALDNAELVAAMNVCPEGQSLHPFSECPRCGPAECVTGSSFVNPTPNAVTNAPECPDGFVLDVDEDGHEISDKCIILACADEVVKDNSGEERHRRAAHAAPGPDHVSKFADGLVSTETLSESETAIREILGETGFVVSSEPAAGDTTTQVGSCVDRDITTIDCNLKSNRARWELSEPHNARLPELKAPVCQQAQWSRANHLGNGIGGQQNGHNFTIPDHVHEHCAMRVRYNITTKDYGQLDPHNSGEVNSTLNRRSNGRPAAVDIGMEFGFKKTDTRLPEENFRGYLWENNPKVSIFDFHTIVRFCANENLVVEGDDTLCRTTTTSDDVKRAYSVYCPAGYDGILYGSDGTPTGMGNDCAVTCTSTDINLPDVPSLRRLQCNDQELNNVNQLRDTEEDDEDGNKDHDFKLQLAINTNQFGRTFQDRSHSYAMRELSQDLKTDCRRILALNVRGKRGNIVQTFPGTEYDFVPNILEVTQGDCIHFQWTGSNTNPNNNDGQGKQGTDRSNIGLLEKNRGEGAGGRGVQRFGGKGAQGKTWTTLNMEPGYENFEFNLVPTMADLQCDNAEERQKDTPLINNVPYEGWRYCTNCQVSDFKPIMANGQCMTGYRLLSQQGVCQKNGIDCQFANRARNPTQFSGVGVDARDPSFSGFDDTQVAAIESQKFGHWGNSHPEHLHNVTKWNVLGLSYAQALNLISLDNVQFRGEMSELDDAGTYFDMRPHKVTGPVGSFYYLCTRNNNFSNRSQKGKIIVQKSMEETNACGGTGCKIGIPTADAMASDPGSEDAVFEMSDVKLTVPPKSIDSFEVVTVKLLEDSGMSDGSSDVLLVNPPNLISKTIPLPAQLNVVANNMMDRRNRREAHAAPVDSVTSQLENELNMMAAGETPTGLWVSADRVNQTAILIHIRSPDTMLIQKMKELQEKELRQWNMADRVDPYLCISLMHDDEVMDWPQPIDARNEVLQTVWFGILGGEWINKLSNGELWVDIKFPTPEELNMSTCSGFEVKSQIDIDPESGKKIKVEIPVAPSIVYGDVFWWPINEITTACFERGEKCDQALQMSDRETVDADCGGGFCKLEREQAGGYYQVSSRDNLPIIAAVSTMCVLLALVFVGSAVYFRKNPEKWEAFKQYGPKKYKMLQRSLAPVV